jgi:hypothetical protein
MMSIPILMTIYSGIRVILMVLAQQFNNLRGYRVGITDVRDLRCMPLKWPQVA